MILQVVEIPSRQKVITDTRLSLSSFQSTIALTYNDDGQPSATHTARLLNLPFLFLSFFFLFFFETLVVHEIGSGGSTSQSASVPSHEDTQISGGFASLRMSRCATPVAAWPLPWIPPVRVLPLAIADVSLAVLH